MENLIDRLSSFLFCPDHILLPTRALAESGFWYTGYGDETECYRCFLRLRGWTESDNPAEKHVKYRPQCPVARETYQSLTKTNSNSVTNENRLLKQDTSKWTDPRQSIPYFNCTHQDTRTTTMQGPSQVTNFHSTNVRVHERNYSPSKDNMHSDNQQALSNKSSEGTAPGVLLERNACSHSGTYYQGKRLLSNEPGQDSLLELGSQRPRECVKPAPYEPDLDIYEGSKDTVPQTHTVPTTAVDYKVASNRMETFKDWPSNATISADDAVEAGFYYVGEIDKVQCAWCKGRLYDWEKDDTAMGEHSKHFPQCPFVLQWQASADTNTHQKHKHLAQATEHNTGDNNVLKPNRGKTEENSVARQEQVDWHSFSAVKLALDMGFDESMIERAVQEHQLTSSILTPELLDILFEIENEGDLISEKTGTSPTATSSQKATDAEPTTEKTFETELSLLVDENQRLKSTRRCTVCLQEEISTMFMPCRHLVCCKTCSDSVDMCPLCRAPIVGTVKPIIS